MTYSGDLDTIYILALHVVKLHAFMTSALFFFCFFKILKTFFFLKKSIKNASVRDSECETDWIQLQCFV